MEIKDYTTEPTIEDILQITKEEIIRYNKDDFRYKEKPFKRLLDIKLQIESILCLTFAQTKCTFKTISEKYEIIIDEANQLSLRQKFNTK